MRKPKSATAIGPGIRARRHVPAWAIVGTALVLVGIRYFDSPREDHAAVDFADRDRAYVVARVVDGDTLLLDGGQPVRLIGVDTPESVAPDRPVQEFGPEASEFTRRLVEGKSVRLSFDKERTDRYGRTLAYVYVGDLFLNAEIIRAGFSEARTHFPYTGAMKKRFREAEAEARQAKRGLWSSRTVEDGSR